jgi:hypothetical protein
VLKESVIHMGCYSESAVKGRMGPEQAQCGGATKYHMAAQSSAGMDGFLFDKAGFFAFCPDPGSAQFHGTDISSGFIMNQRYANMPFVGRFYALIVAHEILDSDPGSWARGRSHSKIAHAVSLKGKALFVK